MKYAWIDAHRKEYELTDLCRALTVSLSGYRAWKRGGTPDRKRLTDAQMLALIEAIHRELKGAYGSPRMVRELRDRGFPASKERVERLMRESGIRARHKRQVKATTDSKHALAVAPNLLDRNFTPAAPNQVWTADMTCIRTDEGWLRLAVVLDLFNREVVGWSIKPRMPRAMRCASNRPSRFATVSALPPCLRHRNSVCAWGWRGRTRPAAAYSCPVRWRAT